MIKRNPIKIASSIMFIIIALIQVVESFDSLIKLSFLIIICLAVSIFYFVYLHKIKNEYGIYLALLIPIMIVGIISASSYKIYTLNNSQAKDILDTTLFDTSTSINVDKDRLSDKNYVLTIGLLYYEGNDNLNLMKDYTLAYKYLNMAQAMGNINAYLPLAKIYYYGQGIEQNHQIAYEYCKKIIFSEYKPYEVITLIEKIIKNDKVITDNETIKKVEIIKKNYLYLTKMVSNFNKSHMVEEAEVNKLVVLANENYTSAADLLTNYYWGSGEAENIKASFYADEAFKLGARSELISLIRAVNNERTNKVTDPIDTIMQYSNFEKHIWLSHYNLNKKHSIFDKYRVSRSIIENPRDGIRPNDSLIFDSLKFVIKKEILSKKPILSKHSNSL